jgi:hypothetical protein
MTDWLAVMNSEAAQARGIPDVDLGSVLMAWLAVRVPRAEAAEKSRFTSMTPAERIEIYKALTASKENETTLRRQQMIAGAAAMKAQADNIRARTDLEVAEKQGEASTETASINARNDRDLLNAASVDTWAKANATTDTENASASLNSTGPISLLSSVQGTNAEKLGSAMGALADAAAVDVNKTTDAAHRAAVARAYLDRMDAAIQALPKDGPNALTNDDLATYEALKAQYTQQTNVPMARDAAGKIFIPKTPSPLEGTSISNANGGVSRLAEDPSGQLSNGGGPVGAAPAAQPVSAPVYNPPAPRAGIQRPSDATVGEMVRDPKTGTTTRVATVIVSPDNQYVTQTLLNGSTIITDRTAFTGNIPVAAEGIAAEQEHQQFLLDQLKGDRDRPSPTIALKLFDQGAHPLDEHIGTYNKAYEAMTPQQQADQDKRMLAMLRANAPAAKAPTKTEVKTATLAEEGVKDLTMGGESNFGGVPTASERAKQDREKSKEVAAMLSDDLARISGSAKGQSMIGQEATDAAYEELLQKVDEETKGLTPAAKALVADQMDAPPEVVKVIRARLLASAVPKMANTRFTATEEAADDATLGAAFSAAAQAALVAPSGAPETPDQRRARTARALASPGSAKGEDIGTDFLVTPGGAAMATEGLGITPEAKAAPTSTAAPTTKKEGKVRALSAVPLPTGGAKVTMATVESAPRPFVGKAVPTNQDEGVDFGKPLSPLPKSTEEKDHADTLRADYLEVNPKATPEEVDAEVEKRLTSWRKKRVNRPGAAEVDTTEADNARKEAAKEPTP